MSFKSLTPEQQLAWNLDVRRGRAGTARQQLGSNRDLPPPDGTVSASAPAPRAPFRPARAAIQSAVASYPPASLLGAPIDIRLVIFALAEDDIKGSGSPWNQKAKTQYDSLRLVSRQVYHELEATHWQHWLVHQNRVNDLLSLQFFKEGIFYCKKTGKVALKSNSPLLKNFRSLTLEIDLASSPKLCNQITIALQTLPLTDLKLFFTGKDDYGTQTSSGSCGVRPVRSFEKLPASGQRFNDRARLVNTLMTLENLETLVVSNANLPVTYNQVINNKPRLSKLSIVPDRRTSLTYDWYYANNNTSNPMLQNATSGSTIKLNWKDMPPLLELEISANAMLYSFHMVKGALRSLEKLTWIVPDPSHQAGDVPGQDLNWLGQSREILQFAAMHSQVKLKTLRICIEHGIYDIDEEPLRNDRWEVFDLVNSLQTDLRIIQSLRNFEIHMNYISKFPLDGFQFVKDIALGVNIERYYISEAMITTDNTMIPEAVVNVEDVEIEYDRPLSEDANLHFPAARVLSVHHNLAREMTIGTFGVHSFALFKSDDQLCPAQEKQQKPRTDRIKNHTALAFLGYEFTDLRNNLLRIVESTDEAPITPADALPDDDEDRVRLLRLNGRLLDRERNKHMYAEGYKLLSAKDEFREDEIIDEKTVEVEFSKLKIIEDEADDDEAAADPAELPTRRYPVIVRAGKHGHWMCDL